jgi:hypothetical protein
LGAGVICDVLTVESIGGEDDPSAFLGYGLVTQICLPEALPRAFDVLDCTLGTGVALGQQVANVSAAEVPSR